MQTIWQITLLWWCLASQYIQWADAAGASLVFEQNLFVHEATQSNATVPRNPQKTPNNGLRVKQDAKKARLSSKSKKKSSGKKSGKKGKKSGPVRTVKIEPFLVGLLVKDLKGRPPLNDVIDLIDLTEEFYVDSFKDGTIFQDSFRSVELTYADDYTYTQAHGSFNYLLNLTARVNFDKSTFRESFNDKIMIFMDDKVDLDEYVEEYVREISTFRSAIGATIIIPSNPTAPPQQSKPIAPTAPLAPSPIAPSAPSPVAAPVEAPVGEPSATTTLPTSSMMPTKERFEITLDLSQVPEDDREVFTAAADRWSQVVVGDLESIEGTTESSCGALVPEMIDDLFICATVQEIDGVDGVLGSAGPEFARFTPTTVPYIGAMRFDSADIEELKKDGSLSSVILHEMGHVLGLGTLWTLNNLQTSAEAGSAKPPCPYNANSKASEEYQAISGCTGTAVPIEADGGPGTECGHWDEQCLKDELMTGFSTGSLPLSRITVASLEDMGYVVDYGAADPYTSADLDPSCVCSSNLQQEADTVKDKLNLKRPETTTNVHKLSTFGLSTLFSSPSDALVEKIERGDADNSPSNITKATTRGGRNRNLSEGGRQIALDYGKKLLQRNKELKASLPHELAARYVGDLAVLILYREHGEIYSVEIQGE